jgi:hypothetical protein
MIGLILEHLSGGSRAMLCGCVGGIRGGFLGRFVLLGGGEEGVLISVDFE